MSPATQATPRRRSAADIAALAFTGGVPKHSLIAAVVVGTLLNLINQGDMLFAGGEVDLVKCALTYMVPYCVATYGAVYAKIRMADHGPATADEKNGAAD